MKSISKQFAVIGLGRFGSSVCRELSDSGAEVLAVDINEARVNAVSNITNNAIVANCSNEETAQELKLDEYDMVMVAIGSDVNASILTTLVVKELGAKNVWVKANDKFHAKILQKIGADHVILPERDMGVRVARKMLDRRVFDFHDIGSGLAISEIVIALKNMGKKLGDVSMCKDADMKVLAIKRGPEIIDSPDYNTVLEMGDILFIVGPHSAMAHRMKSM
ncbi:MULTISPECIES: potassium channel family protein [Vibrio]|uniref:TrkA family potassium uptake protein n=1 Tax=Vibrio algicola TaxID=2662262 RepID=A0A5Q0THB9_9VIBR|nr:MULTISPECIES: TrkA family potassium uptake protein [Vibrio]MBD1577726.1 TrkA family potassium uptake protein [Vibrio sp. S11_S32]